MVTRLIVPDWTNRPTVAFFSFNLHISCRVLTTRELYKELGPSFMYHLEFHFSFFSIKRNRRPPTLCMIQPRMITTPPASNSSCPLPSTNFDSDSQCLRGGTTSPRVTQCIRKIVYVAPWLLHQQLNRKDQEAGWLPHLVTHCRKMKRWHADWEVVWNLPSRAWASFAFVGKFGIARQSTWPG